MTDRSGFYETEVRIQARPETVFGFFTDPARMLQWMGVDAAVDGRVGGSYRVNVTGRETAIGEFLEIAPPERIRDDVGLGQRPGHARLNPRRDRLHPGR